MVDGGFAGTLIVDAGNTGICLYIFSGECLVGEPVPSKEGLAEWIPFDRINEFPVVEDLSVLLSKINAMKRGDPPFGRYRASMRRAWKSPQFEQDEISR